MTQTTPLGSFTAPLGKQQIELHQIEYPGGGLPLLRVRIREGKRFTVFDIDPQTADAWGAAMVAWAASGAGAGAAGLAAGTVPPER